MLDDLILLRLLAVKDSARGEIRSRIVADLRAFSSGTAVFADVVEKLIHAGDVIATGRGNARLQLTDTGRARVCASFGIPTKATPPGTGGWAWWRDRYAVPRALGVRQLDDAGALRTALLRRLYLPELAPAAITGSLLATVDLLLAKQLRTPRATLGAFRTAALRAWVNDGSPTPQTPSTASPGAGPAAGAKARLPPDEDGFAAAVRTATRDCETGRFGDDKIFISHVWNKLLATGHAAPDEERSFKERLVRANTAGRLRLSRADLAGAHDARDVRASETPYLGEIFHFIRLD